MGQQRPGVATGDVMTPKAGSGIALLLLLLGARAVLAAPSTVVLSVEGMT